MWQSCDCKTNSTFLIIDSLVHPPFTYLSTENTRAILPMARILLRMTSLRAEAVAPDGVRGHKESNRPHFLHHNASGWDSILISNHWTRCWLPFPWRGYRLYPHITTCCLPTQNTRLRLPSMSLGWTVRRMFFFIALQQLIGQIFGLLQPLRLQS